MTPAPLALNLGCGQKPMADGERGYVWINVDIRPGRGVVVWDLTRTPWPWAAGSIAHVLMDNVLEHFASADAIRVLNEIGRVLQDGGTAEIIVPHAFSQGAHQDPTHVSQWVPRSALYWSSAYTPYGGPAVGITAELLIDREPEVWGDPDTELFITFRMRRAPRSPA